MGKFDFLKKKLGLAGTSLLRAMDKILFLSIFFKGHQARAPERGTQPHFED